MDNKEKSRQFIVAAPPDSITQYICLHEASRIDLPQGGFFPFQEKETFFSLLSPLSGCIAVLRGDNVVLCQAGQGVLLLPEDIVSIRSENNCSIDYATLSGELVEKLLRETAEDGWFFPRVGALAELVSNLLHANDSDIAIDGKEAAAAAFTMLMRLYGTSTAPEQSAYPPLVATAIAIMRAEFATLYGVEELATQLGVTKHHFIRVFTATVGVSPGKYMTKLRIDYAKLILRSGEPSLEVVAAASGFSGADYFSKVFRRETGLSPRRYAALNPSTSAVLSSSLYV